MSDLSPELRAVAEALPLYDIQGELGRGAWGVVLAGRHRQLDRDVAIKQLPPAFGADPAVRTRFLAEARVLAQFEHPHIVPIYDFIEHGGLCMLVMERLTGGTVLSRARAGGFTPAEACALTLAACAGLHYAHQRGVLHRDVKPENLMFSGAGVLKVADFGIAKVVGGAATVATRAGDVLGTPAYMAPEQAQGGELTPATDMYAVGTVLYQLLSGQLPFSADSNPIAMLYRHVHEDPVPLGQVAPHVPVAIAAVTARALAKDPARRYADAEQMAVAIAEAAASAWGERWLPATGTTVTATGPVLSAAVGHRSPALQETLAPDFVVPSALGSVPEEAPSGLVPLTSLPSFRSFESAGSGGSPLGDDATIAPGVMPPLASPGARASAPVRPRREMPGAAPPPPPPPPSAPQPSAPQPAASTAARRSRRPLLLALVGVLVLAVVGAVLVATRNKKTSTTTEVATSPSLKPTDWRALKDAPTARQQFAVAVDGGSVLVAGGITDAASTATVERYDTQHDQWSKGPDLPLPVHHEMAATFGGRTVIMGGWLPQGDALNAVTSDRVFELRGNKWKELPKLPHARAAGAAAVVGDKLVVFGGQASGKLVPETDVFDGKAWSAGPNLPTARDHLGGVSDGKYVYALGGRDLSPDKNLDAVERFDPTSNKWDPIAPLPAPRGDVAAALIAGRIFVIGGETSTQVFPTNEALDLRTTTWGPAPAMPTARHGLGVAAVGSTLYAFGGALRPGHTASATTTEGLAFAEGASAGPVQWQKVREAPTPRQQAAAAVDDGTFWVVGGLAPDGPTAKVEGYDPTIDTWKSGPDLPAPVHDAMAATFHGELVVLGGWLSDARRVEARVSDKVYVLRSNQWVELPPLLAGRAAGAAAVVGQRLVVVGGTDGRASMPTTEIFDGTRWSFGADVPTPRDHLAAASDGHYVFAVGGRLGSTGANVAALERYDPDARLWEKLPDMPTARGALGAAIVNGKLVAVGGETPTNALDTVEIFELRSRSWSPGPALTRGRHGLAVASVRAAVFAIDGGLAPGGGQPSTAAEVLRF